MRLQYSIVFAIFSPVLATAVAVPFEDSSLETEGSPTLDLEVRDPVFKCPSPTPSACPSQNPIASNVCSSGSPYCCSGSGDSMVCGPASTTKCTTTTICCINTNGMQICAGEIDFTGPVTITNNINLLNLNLCL